MIVWGGLAVLAAILQVMKRFRDNTGKLTMCVEAIRTETAGEARNYYQIGGKYIFVNDSRVYTYIKNNDEIAQFQSPDGFTLLIPLESLGMYRVLIWN